MKKAPLALACAIIFILRFSAMGDDLKIGDTPPPIEFKKVLQAPPGAKVDWAALKGKVVVLEFWATWCGPCIAAIPHLNELADKFKDEPVRFVAITDEDENVVEPFLIKKPIHAWVGLDGDKSVFKGYGVTAIPHTVVVDQTGRVAAITGPTELTAQHVKDLLSGKKVALVAPQRNGFSFHPGELPGSTSGDRAALFQVEVRPSEILDSAWGSSGGNFTFIGSSVMQMLSGCYGISSVRIMTNSDLLAGKFDVVVKTPVKNDELGRNWLRQAVETSFGLIAKRERKEMDVVLLTVKNSKAEHLTSAVSTGGSSSQSRPGQMQAINQAISSLAASLEGLLSKPVLDDTGLTNHYDWELKWEAKDPEHPDLDTLATAVQNQLGLELTPARRPVEVLVVEKAK